ncbi:hypothetical protein FGO68_gene14199 [Halteria grandinella]|uniref:RING-type domain-containing protein n=1 Tax=Halteria grandinella TaxID=5974 RepID=A0A8J8NRT1_HALGN|nr:hypothetical protein FGO68_gene14199 [Halteria grandinella]
MQLRVTHQGAQYDINYPDSPYQFPSLKMDSKWEDLSTVLEQVTGIPSEDQMHPFQGFAVMGTGRTLQNLGFFHGMRLALADKRQNINVTVIKMDGKEVVVEYNNELTLTFLKRKVLNVWGTSIPEYRMALVLERDNRKLHDFKSTKQLINGDRIFQVRQSFMYYGEEEYQPSEEKDCITLEVPENPIDFPHCKMPCGHVFSGDTIREVLLRQVNEGAHEVRCPALKEGRVHGICNASWDYPDLPDIFSMTYEEENDFKDKLNENIYLFVRNYVQCPTCKALIPRPSDDPKLTRTHCDECEEAGRGSLDFCYKCGEEWNYEDICLSDFCTFKKQNAVLQECIEIEVDEVRGVPAVRACPNCYTLYEHMEACRHMKCKTPKCKDEEFQYCHICLSQWSDHDPDTCAVAPRQVLPNAQVIQEIKQEDQKEEEPILQLINQEKQKFMDKVSILYEESRQAFEEMQLNAEMAGLIVSYEEEGDTDYNDHYVQMFNIDSCFIF